MIAPETPPWERWARALSMLIGFTVVAVGVLLAVRFMQTPAYLLDQPPISAYAATHTASGAPAAVRTGLWIEVPALGVALPVREGDGSNNIPDWEALHYPGTAEPGQAGNSYLYAHGLAGMFGPLLRARDGEAVVLHDYTSGATMTFHISRVVGSVRWNDVSWIYQQSSTPLLTLQTCIGADLKTDRWIVLATT